MNVFRTRCGACEACGATAGLFTVWFARPWRERVYRHEGRLGWSEIGPVRWHFYVRAHCVDRATCDARVGKRRDRARTRGRMLVLAEPKFPDAPRGECRWCGATLTGPTASRRNYCREGSEGRDCVGAVARSKAWTGRDAIRMRGDKECVDCGSEGAWEADHELALEDGGEHTMENLRRRCVPCHRAKTAREARARAASRRESAAPSGQLDLEDVA